MEALVQKLHPALSSGQRLTVADSGKLCKTMVVVALPSADKAIGTVAVRCTVSPWRLRCSASCPIRSRFGSM